MHMGTNIGTYRDRGMLDRIFQSFRDGMSIEGSSVVVDDEDDHGHGYGSTIFASKCTFPNPERAFALSENVECIFSCNMPHLTKRLVL